MEQKKSFTISITLIAITSLIASLASFMRSGTSINSINEDTLTRIQRTHVMRVCYAVWPPAVIKDPKTGTLSGHDIDTMETMAKEIGASVEYHETTFGDMPAAIQSGLCDIGTSLFIKISRSAAVAFARPVFFGGNSGLVKKGDTRFKRIADVDKPGIRVAVANGESGHIFAQEHFKYATIIPIDVESSDLSRFLLEVTSGRADIGIADANTIRLFAAAHNETTDVFAHAPFDLNPDAYPLRLGDNNFLNFVNNSILYLQTSGTWDQFEKKYDAHWLHEVHDYRVL